MRDAGGCPDWSRAALGRYCRRPECQRKGGCNQDRAGRDLGYGGALNGDLWRAGHGRLWIAQAGHGGLWIARAGHGRLWIAQAGHGGLWIARAGYGRLWIAQVGYGGLWIARAAYGRLWIAQAGNGGLWIARVAPLGPQHGSTRTPQGPRRNRSFRHDRN